MNSKSMSSKVSLAKLKNQSLKERLRITSNVCPTVSLGAKKHSLTLKPLTC